MGAQSSPIGEKLDGVGAAAGLAQPAAAAQGGVERRQSVGAADDGLERAAQAAASAALAEVHVDARRRTGAPASTSTHPQSLPTRGAGSSSRCSSCRWRSRPRDRRRSRPCASGPPCRSRGGSGRARSAEISQPTPRSFSKRRHTSLGLRHLLDDGAAVARPQVDARLGAQDRLGLVEQHVGVVGRVGVVRLSVASALHVGADRGGVVVDVPVGEPAMDGRAARPSSPRTWPRTRAACAGRPACTRRPRPGRGWRGGRRGPGARGRRRSRPSRPRVAGRGGEDQRDVVFVVEPVEPREDEAGRADGRAEVAQSPGSPQLSCPCVFVSASATPAPLVVRRWPDGTTAGRRSLPRVGARRSPPRGGGDYDGARGRARASFCGTTSRCGRRTGLPAGPAKPA